MSQSPKWRAVNAVLVKKDKEAITKREATHEEFGQAVRGFIINGYKIGISFEPTTDAIILAITGKDSTGPDWNKSFMFFHARWNTIMSILVYVFEQSNDYDSLSRMYDRYFDSDW